MATGRVTKSGAYAELGGASEQVTQAGAYVEIGQSSISAQVTQAGAYVEIKSIEVRVTQLGPYVELVTEGHVTQIGAYVEIEQPPPPKPSANREPAFYCHLQRPDFSESPSLPFELMPLRWSWTRPGGPDRATVEVMGTERNVWQMLPAFLRAPVTIYNNNHSQLWWGYVAQIELFANDMVVGLSLDGLYNRVAVTYNDLPAGGSSSTPAVTAWVQNDESVSRFGTKELLQQYGDATSAQAEAVRDGILSAFQYVLPDVRPGRSNVVGRLICRGWWQTLGWRYYENSGTASTVISDQIGDIVTAVGDYFTGFDAVDAHAVSSNEYRDGTETAQQIIEQLLQTPSGGAAVTATVTKERLLRFGVEGSSGVEDWVLLPNSQFRTYLGGVPDPGREIIGWTQLRGMLPTDSWGYMNSPTPLYIEENEFDAQSLTYQWRARGAQSPWL